jgi:hypothetical protein
MFDRIWWFVTGTVLGGFLTVRALRRTPQPRDLAQAAAQTGADLLDLAARAIRARR